MIVNLNKHNRDELPMVVLNAKTAEECGKILQDNIQQHVGVRKQTHKHE